MYTYNVYRDQKKRYPEHVYVHQNIIDITLGEHCWAMKSYFQVSQAIEK